MRLTSTVKATESEAHYDVHCHQNNVGQCKDTTFVEIGSVQYWLKWHVWVAPTFWSKSSQCLQLLVTPDTIKGSVPHRTLELR